jgi:hypothetical protein
MKGVAMKGLVTTLAFSGAAGLTALIVAIQQDPFAFTRLARTARVELTAEPVGVVPVTVVTTIEEEPPAVSNVITLEEVDVVASPARRFRPVAKPAPEPEPVVPEIVPAPCVDGQYRKLEPGRGVYLMCPGGAAGLKGGDD